MWNRKELKKQGKRIFFRNWLAIVSVCFLLAFIGAEYTNSVSFIHEFDPQQMRDSQEVVEQRTNLSNWDILLQWLNVDPQDGAHPMWAAADQQVKPYFDTLTQPFSAFFAFLVGSQFTGWLGLTLAIVGVAVSLWFTIWVVGTFTVGARRYFLESRVRDQISLAAAFTPFGRGRWWNVTKGILLKDMLLFLWLFTIVGFPIKLYSYRMVPYLLAENPYLTPTQALGLSRQMMDGQKWRCFVMDVTLYLHWQFLPSLLAGVLSGLLVMVTGVVSLATYLPLFITCLLQLLFLNGYKAGIYTQLYTVLRQGELDRQAALAETVFIVKAFGEAPVEGPKPKKKDLSVRAPEDPVFHFAHRHKLDYNRRYSLRCLILIFFAFAFVGWAWEVGLHIAKDGIFVNRGTMFGPWLPIYGVGGAMALVLLKKFFRSPPATFLVSMVLCSCIEYFASWYLELSKGIRWWDYSGYFMNLNGRICLEGAVVFGLGCCAAVYFIGPLLAERIDKIPPQKQTALCLVLVALFAGDMAYSHVHPNAGKGITDYDTWKEGTSALPPPSNETLLL